MSIFRIELRRTIAPWLGLAVLAISLGFLFLLTGPWWHIPAMWTTQTTTSALWVRYLLQFLWPLVIGAGAIQGMRDHRSGMSELLESTPRPAAHRAAKLALAVGAMVLLGYLAVFAVGFLEVPTHNGFVSAAFVPHVLVALLALLAAAWLGLGLGRLLPHPLTAPAVAVVAFALLVVLWSALDSTVGFHVAVPTWIAMLGPAVAQPHGVFATTAGSHDVGQAIWFTGLALTGFALLAAKFVRSKLIGLLPAVLAAAVAVPIFPADTLVTDNVAAAKVCDGPVCVTKLHEASLPSLRTAGREALGLLSKLPGAPTKVEEVTDVVALSGQPHDPAAAYINFQTAPSLLNASSADLRAALLAGAGAPECLHWNGDIGDLTARTVSAAWFTGELKALPRGLGVGIKPGGTIEQAWQAFRQIPEPEQVRRMAALRQEYLNCAGDPMQTLLPGFKP